MTSLFAHVKFYFYNTYSRVLGLLFVANSFVFGNWVARIPDIKESLWLTDAALGMGLLGAPLGSILVMPFTGWLVSLMGLGRSLYLFSALFLLSPVMLANITSFNSLLACLIYLGITEGLMGVVINAAANGVEKKLERPIMSTCHGMWSLGAMMGAAMGSVIAGLNIALRPHLLMISLAVLIPLLLSPKIIQMFDTLPSPEQKKGFQKPNMALLAISLAAFSIFLNEGAIADWSAVYLRDTLKSDPYLVGMAYAGYAMFMAIGRFTGDMLIPKFGKKNLVIGGGLLSALSMSALLILHDPWAAIVGFSLVGLGFSCIVPILYSSAANEPGYTAESAIAVVSTISFIGFFIGPPIIGFISEQYGLSLALVLVVGLSIMISAIGTMIQFK
jgi:MFS family permease